MKKKKLLIFIIVLILSIVVISGCAAADTTGNGTGTTTAGEQTVDEGAGPLGQLLGSRSQSLQLVGLLTILSIAPSIIIMLSGFTRIVIVLSFTRNALGLQQMPPNQVIIVLALFLTFFVMSPVLSTVKTEAIDPYVNGQITFEQAVDKAEVPIRGFMLRNTFQSDINMFNEMAETPATTLEEVPMTTVIPAFLTSEIKRAFTIGFFIYIPFIVIDMVVASVLMSMGMMMLPPIVISLPFKVLLFVLVDGWTLTISTLIRGFN